MIDRRCFVQKALLLAAGSAFGCSLNGCGGYEFDIPCLGPAAPPVPVPGMTYIRASEIGCALDCDLASGRNKYSGGAATDDGPRINAAIAGASADNPITLIIDGSTMISGLFLPAGGYWNIAGLGCNTGFFVKRGTNNDGIHNGPPNAAVPSDPGPPAPARGRNVSLSNFTLNGNQGAGLNGDATSGVRRGTSTTWYFGINLTNLDNIVIENVVVVNTPAYHIRLSNVGNVAVSGCVMKSFGLNTDGLHFDGPANDVTISNCSFTTGDDAIALNCPEGYTGNISRVAVSGCIFNSSSLMRLYTTTGSGGKFYIDTVSVTTCRGVLAEAAFLIGLSSSSNPSSVASLAVSDCDLTAGAVLEIAENFGTITLKNVTFVPSQPGRRCGFLRPSPLETGISCVGSSVSFDNCTIYRKANREVSGVILDYDATIGNIEFKGFAVQDDGSYSPAPELLTIMSGSIEQLALDSLNTANIRACVSGEGFTSVGCVSGTGVLATGWEFPDAVMANEVPYISASTCSPSIKVDGVVEPYLQS